MKLYDTKFCVLFDISFFSWFLRNVFHGLSYAIRGERKGGSKSHWNYFKQKPMKLLQITGEKFFHKSSLANNKVCILNLPFCWCIFIRVNVWMKQTQFIKRSKRQPSHFANSSKNAGYPSLKVGEVFCWE